MAGSFLFQWVKRGEKMLNTYKAILKNNRLEWSEDMPEQITPERAVPVYVTILDIPDILATDSSRGQRMADVLEQLAAGYSLTDLADPMVWEREIRRDRDLPNRE